MVVSILPNVCLVRCLRQRNTWLWVWPLTSTRYQCPLVTSLTSDWPFRLAGMVEPPPPVHGNSNRRSVSTLRPSAKDAYMLFQVRQQRGSSVLLIAVAPRLQIKVAEF